MATDLEPHKITSKSEAYLQRKFADLGARIRRVDLVTHLLALALTIAGYAFFIGTFDLGFLCYAFIGTQDAARVAALYVSSPGAVDTNACAYVRTELALCSGGFVTSVHRQSLGACRNEKTDEPFDGFRKAGQ